MAITMMLILIMVIVMPVLTLMTLILVLLILLMNDDDDDVNYENNSDCEYEYDQEYNEDDNYVVYDTYDDDADVGEVDVKEEGEGKVDYDVGGCRGECDDAHYYHDRGFGHEGLVFRVNKEDCDGGWKHGNGFGDNNYDDDDYDQGGCVVS